MPTAKLDWERAEAERSLQEAQRTPADQLLADEQQVVRYLDPSLDSPYPLQYAFALLGDIRGFTVLDLGCGSGANALLLARRGAHVVGVDISAALIALARRRLDVNGLSGAAHFIVGSAHDLPVTSERVDLVLGIGVLHHLDLELASLEVWRVLKAGGRAVFKEPVRDSRLLRAARQLVPYRAPCVSPFERPLTSSELRRFASPFRTDSSRAFSLPFTNVVNAIVPLRGHLGRLYRCDAAVLDRFPVLERLAGLRVFALSKHGAPPQRAGAADA